MMKYTRIAISLILLPWLRGEQPPKELLGRWVSVARMFDRTAESMTFYKDGTFDFSIADVSEAAYRVEGSELVEFSPSTAEPEQRIKIEFTGPDQLRFGVNVLKRQGAAADAKRLIVGEWAGTREAEGRRYESHLRFYPDGRYLFVTSVRQHSGKYTIEGSTMRMVAQDSSVTEGEFRIAGDVLTIPGPRATQAKFRRY
jgi:hypothetical protein